MDEEKQEVEEKQEEKLFKQEELDAIIKERLAREREKYKDYDDLKKRIKEIEEQQKANLPEVERLKVENEEIRKLLAEKEKEIRNKEIYNLKLELLDAEGLPKSWAKRISGETEEEIKADIKDIKKLLGEKEKEVGKGTAPASSSQPFSMNDILRGK